MRAFINDLRYGLRLLAKRPGFSAIAVVTLALAIGANTAIFSIVNNTLLRRLPYKNPETILTIWQTNPKTGEREDGAAPGNFLDWREQNSFLEELASAEPYSHRFTGSGEPESFRSWLVSEGFFETLGVEALYGRTFQPQEHQAGNERVVIIGEGLWRGRFGGDPGLLGQTLLLNGQPHTVVGIMPASFEFPAGRALWGPRVTRDRDKQERGSGY